MKLYADAPGRRGRQISADVLMVVWVVAFVWLGRFARDGINSLQGPADSIRTAGDTVQNAFSGAGDAASGVPGVGGTLERWFDQASTAGGTLSGSGSSMASSVGNVATLVGAITAVVPILAVGGIWLFWRIRFVRRATDASRFAEREAGLDLLALRALGRRPLSALTRVDPDPAGSWRRQDPTIIRALAMLELDAQGVRPKAAAAEAGVSRPG